MKFSFYRVLVIYNQQKITKIKENVLMYSFICCILTYLQICKKILNIDGSNVLWIKRLPKSFFRKLSFPDNIICCFKHVISHYFNHQKAMIRNVVLQKIKFYYYKLVLFFKSLKKFPLFKIRSINHQQFSFNLRLNRFLSFIINRLYEINE